MSAGLLPSPSPPGPFMATMEFGFGLWRLFWFDLPLAWFAEIERAATAIAMPGAMPTPAHAVASLLGGDAILGGEYLDEALSGAATEARDKPTHDPVAEGAPDRTVGRPKDACPHPVGSRRGRAVRGLRRPPGR